LLRLPHRTQMADIRSGVQNYLAVEEPASLDRYYAITTIMCQACVLN